MKRVLCLFLILIITFLCVPIATASAASKFTIYFDASGWQDTTGVQCYIGEIDNNQNQFGWLTGEREQNSIYSFELSNYKDYDKINSDLQNNCNLIIFFQNFDGLRTCYITIGKSCAGDTLKLTGKTVKNLLDASKTNYDAVWKNNNEKYGSHLEIASYGDIIGSKLCPNESKTAFIGNWLSSYYNDFEIDAAATVVSNAMKKVKYYNTDEIYKYIQSSYNLVNSRINSILSKAQYNTCGIISLKKNKTTLYIGGTYKIPITKKGNYKKLTCKSKNKKIATVTNAGKITAKKIGTTIIKIKTPYVTKKFSVTVKKPYIKIKGKNLLMTVNEKAKLSFKAMPKKGYKTTWKSSNPEIVKVTSKGVIKAVKQGKAYITVTMKYKGKKYTNKCKVISLKL